MLVVCVRFFTGYYVVLFIYFHSPIYLFIHSSLVYSYFHFPHYLGGVGPYNYSWASTNESHSVTLVSYYQPMVFYDDQLNSFIYDYSWAVHNLQVRKKKLAGKRRNKEKEHREENARNNLFNLFLDEEVEYILSYSAEFVEVRYAYVRKLLSSFLLLEFGRLSSLVGI